MTIRIKTVIAVIMLYLSVLILHCLALSSEFAKASHRPKRSLVPYPGSGFQLVRRTTNSQTSANRTLLCRGFSTNQGQNQTCHRNAKLCYGMNHPLCNIRFPVVENENDCSVRVACDFPNTEEADSACCYASRNAFPPPKYGNVNAATVQYYFQLRLYDHSRVLFHNISASGTQVGAAATLLTHLGSHTNRLGHFSIFTIYNCTEMAFCNANG